MTQLQNSERRWLMSWATGIPVSVLGLFRLTDLVPYDDRLFHQLVEVH
jgi:hypothetical protein